MGVNRRDFLKMSGVTMGVMFCPSFLRDAKAQQYSWTLKTKEGVETTSICPYCGVGCGIVITASEGKMINAEGDPDHPTNEGALCSKGSSLFQTYSDPAGLRNTTVRWRPPRSNRWFNIPWFMAMIMMAQRIKRTRDRNFTAEDADGNVVNRTEGIAAMGGASLDNEECYLYTKLMRSLGIIYLEHQARI
jgi:formate dehydrogenase major subunit